MSDELTLRDGTTIKVFQTQNYINIVSETLEDYFEPIYRIINQKHKQEYFFIVFNARACLFGNNCFPIKKIISWTQKAKQQNKKIIFIFEMKYEAPSYRYNLKKYFDDLIDNVKIPKQNIIIWSGAHHQFSDNINFVVEEFTCFGRKQLREKFHKPPVHHFVSLARIPRPHRVLATQMIWDKKLERYGFCSLGATSNRQNLNFELLRPEYANRVPALIDGYVDSFEDQRNSEAIQIQGAFAHMVLETSFDREYQKKFWNTVFFTEKTFKPFTLGQVPIFVTVQGHVEKLREYGFDLFDDLIDHSYDKVADPLIRIEKSINQLEKICALEIDQLRNYKKDNLFRFKKNHEIAQKIADIDSPNRIARQLDKILNLL